MSDNNYSSVICEYCRWTDLGYAKVNTGPWNMCEGQGCQDAYEAWQEDNPDDDSTLESLF